MTRKGYLEEIKRIEVHESNKPTRHIFACGVEAKQRREVDTSSWIYQGLLMEPICYVFIVLWVMGMME